MHNFSPLLLYHGRDRSPSEFQQVKNGSFAGSELSTLCTVRYVQVCRTYIIRSKPRFPPGFCLLHLYGDE